MKININKLRNRAINATVTVLNKAKAPDNFERITKMIDSADLTDEQKLATYRHLSQLIKESDNA